MHTRLWRVSTEDESEMMQGLAYEGSSFDAYKGDESSKGDSAGAKRKDGLEYEFEETTRQLRYKSMDKLSNYGMHDGGTSTWQEGCAQNKKYIEKQKEDRNSDGQFQKMDIVGLGSNTEEHIRAISKELGIILKFEEILNGSEADHGEEDNVVIQSNNGGRESCSTQHYDQKKWVFVGEKR
ncbi:hypothetical protein VNO78_15234 [Psophocarpus tetragonolobus]|uniref:Uncharacterized protein n=1 Tax=Psophocarpus tetragonolobus TaxID=3891 RepID=A0AAN9SFP8_PSOTE